MSKTIGRIARDGRIHFTDAALRIWEEGIPQDWTAARAWERQFKRDVFTRIVQTLRRIGWTVMNQKHIFTGNNNRYCRKGNLRADLKLMGRCIEFEMFQNVNAPQRPDHGGRYQFDQEKHMPYLLRIEMERTRRRIRDYLVNVFTGYEFKPPKVSSPNPDPLAYFNSHWDSEYELKRGTHRFTRGDDGWPIDRELGSYGRKDKDGVILTQGATRWDRGASGRLRRGRVYGGINGMWTFVYGPGERDFAHKHAGEFFSYQPGITAFKHTEARHRDQALRRALDNAIADMRFERAAVLRDVINPPALAIA